MTVDGNVIRCDRFGCRAEAEIYVPSEVPMTAPGLAYEVRRWSEIRRWRASKEWAEARGGLTIVHCISDQLHVSTRSADP